MSKIKSVRGMQDIVPAEIGSWQFIEKVLRQVFTGYGYKEIRFPIMEYTELFDRSIGEETDIVSKEMYTFLDRGGESVSLRPEGTAGCLRASLNNDLIRTDTPRLWYLGPMFRYERPQKGRLRQFHQASLEAYGMKGPNIDVEMILITSRLWKELGLKDSLRLEINSLGTKTARKKYIEALKEYLNGFKSQLDVEVLNRIEKNPLRVLDTKDPEMQLILESAPSLTNFLEPISKDHFEEVLELLDSNSIRYTINSRLVRGLDYYNDTVFEWKTDAIGSQDAVCGGGRYDSLIKEISGKESSAVGFSIGMDRLNILLNEVVKTPLFVENDLDGYFICLGENSFSVAQSLAEDIRNSLPSFNLKLHYGPEKAASQFKRAHKSGARIALIIGDEEIKNKKISIKDLRHSAPQEEVSFKDLIKRISYFIK